MRKSKISVNKLIKIIFILIVLVSIIFVFNERPKSINTSFGTFRDVSIQENQRIIAIGDQGNNLYSINIDFSKFGQQELSEHWFKSIHFSDSQNGWIVGSSGSVYKTDNSGNSWHNVPTFVDNNLHSCFFKNSFEGIVVGSDGIIMHTLNAGKNWNIKYNKPGLTLYGVSYTDNNIIFVVGQSGYILISNDNCETWQNKNLDNLTERHNLYGIKFDKMGNGAIYGACNTLLLTNNYGRSWQDSNSNHDISIRDLFIQENIIIAVGDSGKISFSINCGLNWKISHIQSNANLYGIAPIDGNSFLIVGSNGIILQVCLKEYINSKDSLGANLEINKIFPQQNNSNPSAIFDKVFKEQFKGKIYRNDPLGEGLSGYIDKDLRINNEFVDCVTVVEQSLGLAICKDMNNYLSILDRIRYRGGNVSYFTRNHFFVSDWIPGNSWCVEDVTTNIGGMFTEKLVRTIGKTKFYSYKQINIPQVKDIIDYEIFYIPTENFEAIANRIDKPMIIVFIGKLNWLFAKHTGMIFRHSTTNELFLRHASSDSSKVVEQPLIPYIMSNNSIIGIKLIEIND
ncbi:MAG: DUF1460 domain-containing protein [Ignavibacteriales bacterium]|nr:DUF1460 domain-containing protein [Ignavibacteriales bacterium]